ncbi:alpha/beta hydrolase [Brevundimonas sp.]|uniref:alpha/beta fold hydrolase n=1 Tax=Brevundimonas sp. TaxID=1871086 RepID=UPI00286C3F35|nr:alpha/beta hydrolase [Brevundimonas sp.]
MSSFQTRPPEPTHGFDTLRRTALKAGALAVSLLASGLAGQATAQSAANQNPAAQSAAGPGGYVRPAAPGRLVEVAADRRLHIFCKGETVGPAVIFEAGLSQFTANSGLAAAQDAIAGFARVCTYDRAGMGWSDPAPEGWTYPDRVRDLHALLRAAGLDGPYVLVGHSLGGLLIRAYAQAYPEQVVGLVLVDATSERNLPEFEAARDSTVSQIDAALAVSQPGVPVIGMPAGTSAEVHMAFTPEVLRGVKAEFEALALFDAATLPPGAPGILGEMPLIVIRRGRTMSPPGEADLNHQQGQEDLAALSSNSVLIVAENSGHMVPLDEPPVVADAVRRVLTALNSPDRRL